ncbi:MAG: YceI family protein [Pseudomonadota bacterium]
MIFRHVLVLLTALVCWGGFTSLATAATWRVDYEKSRIAFSGTHAGTPFSGRFRTWTADITFDQDALDKSKVTVRVELGSAATGNATYDRSLPTADWFNTASGATATFVSDKIERVEGGNYVANGTLDMRGVKVPLRLDFDLSITGDKARMSGRATISRLDFSIGKIADPKGAWVSLEIPVEVDVVATRAP